MMDIVCETEERKEERKEGRIRQVKIYSLIKSGRYKISIIKDS